MNIFDTAIQHAHTTTIELVGYVLLVVACYRLIRFEVHFHRNKKHNSRKR